MLNIHIKMPGFMDCVKTPQKTKLQSPMRQFQVHKSTAKLHKTFKTKECIMIYHVNTNEEEMVL